MFKNRLLNYLMPINLAVLTLVFLKVPFCFYHRHKDFYELVLNLTVSVVAAYIFQIFVVELPAIRQKKIIKKNFDWYYRDFKKQSIAIFLSLVDEPIDQDLVIKLLDRQEFKTYFKKPYKETSQTKWERIFSMLACDYHGLRSELILELDIFSREVGYVLNKTSIDSEDAFLFFKRLLGAAQRNRQNDPGHADIKIFCVFLWEVFTGFNFSEGYRKNDIFQEMLDKI